jgi:hypothetical protein
MNCTRNMSGRARALIAAMALLLPSGAGQALPPQAAPVPSPAPGDSVPAFDAVGIDGKSQHVAYSKGTTVLVFFLSSCPTCHRMIPLWNQAFARKAPDLKVIGVLLDQEPPGFFAATPVSFPVLRSPGKDFLATYKVARVPVTMRVVAPGRVVDVGVGALDAMRVGEIFRRPE